MNEIDLWESEIAEANRFHFFEITNEQMDFLCESLELDTKLLDEGVLTEDMKQIGDAIKEKAASAFLKMSSLVVKLISMITEFFKKIVNNAKIKVLEKKLAKADIDANKLTKALTKASFYDPDALMNKLKDAGLFDFMQGNSKLGLGEEEMNKINANLASALPGLTFSATNELKYKFSSSSIAEINRLIDNTNKAIDKLKGYAISYNKTIDRDKKAVKDSNIFKDRDTIKSTKTYIKVAASCTKAIQKFVKELTKQSMDLYKVQLSLLRGNGETVEDPRGVIDDFEDNVVNVDFGDKDNKK